MIAARNYPINCGLATTSEFARSFAKRNLPGFAVTLSQIPRYSSQPSESAATVQDRVVSRKTPASGVYDLAVSVAPAVSTIESPYITTSDDTAILSDEAAGLLTHAGNGEVMLSTTSSVGEVVRTRVTASSFSAAVIDEFSEWSDNTAGDSFTEAVEYRLPTTPETPVYGSGFANGVLNMLLPPGPYSASGWTRNPAFWLAAIDWSCLSIRNSAGHARGGVLVSPRYAVCAAHFGFSAGQSLTFLTADNVPRVRTVDSVTNFPVFTSYDTCLIRLADPLTYADDGIAFCKVFPSDYADYLPGATRVGFPNASQRGLPVLPVNQDKLMGAGRSFLPNPSDRGFSVSGGDLSGSFYGMSLGIRYLDSGHPTFALIDNEPVLVGTWTNVGSGSNFTGNAGFQQAINAVMANDSEALTTVDLSGFPTY